jgi:L-iditol 2-dehydrogenase
LQAAVLINRGHLSISDVPEPRYLADEVLVKVAACGICRTDMKCLDHGQQDLRMPRILGHEIAGTIAAVGADVRDWQIGQRVQVAPGLGCGDCSYCRHGLDHLCPEMEIIGFHLDGGFAEYLRVPAKGLKNSILNEIPPGLSFAEAALTEPLACSLNMQESLQVGSGDRVIIIGAGPLGILNAKLAVLNGAAQVSLLEEDERRLSRAKGYGFERCFHPAADKGLISAAGIDVVIPCCPGPKAVQQGLEFLKKRGRFGFFSGLLADNQGSIDFNLLHYKELRAYGAYGCSAAHNRRALAHIASGRIRVKEMITRQIGLRELPEGIDLIRRRAETSIIVAF